MNKRKKDPKKVAAGRLGGQVSGGNFKKNPDRAAKAGRLSAWKRSQGKLEDYPLEFIDMPIKIPKGVKRSIKRRAKL